MLRKRYTRVVLLLFLLAFAGGGQQVLQAAATNQKQEAKGNFVFSGHQLPHDELDKTQLSSWAGAQLQHPRTISSAFVLPAGSLADRFTLSPGIYNRQKNLPVKDYLFHIYPSHHFW